MANSLSQPSQFCSHNVFNGIPAKEGQAQLVEQYLSDRDLSPHTVKAIRLDLRKFAKWFHLVNGEGFDIARMTTADVAGFRRHLHEERGQAVATINRCLVTLRRFFAWLVDQEKIASNPAKAAKELRRVQLAPKGLDRTEVRRLLREVELRGDLRSSAIFHLMLYTGARVGDVVGLEVSDVTLSARSGLVQFRFGKGSKQRTVPLPLPARTALAAYLTVRPPSPSASVFIGERGPLTTRGIQALCERYSALIGVGFSPHDLRHTYAHQFLRDGGNLVQLAQILGHSNLNTTQIYTRDSVEQLGQAAERVLY